MVKKAPGDAGTHFLAFLNVLMPLLRTLAACDLLKMLGSHQKCLNSMTFYCHPFEIVHFLVPEPQQQCLICASFVCTVPIIN